MALASDYPTAFGKHLPRILVVEDDDGIRRLVERVLTKMGCIVIGAASVEQARAICERRPLVHLALLDLSLPDGCGAELAGEIHEAFGALPIILFSGRPAPADVPGVVAVLPKPFGVRALIVLVRDALRAAPLTPSNG